MGVGRKTKVHLTFLVADIRDLKIGVCGKKNETSDREMFYLCELLITLKTADRDESLDHRHLLTDANDFSAYIASRLNCGV